MSRELVAFQDALIVDNVASRFIEAGIKTFKTASVQKPLYVHDSKESAYVVDDYPFGFRLRCKIRYWVEFAPKKGYRMVSQTTDPRKTVEVWNNPKASTYALLAGNLYLDSQDHVQCSRLTEYSKAEECAEFVEDFPKADLKMLKPWVFQKIKYCYMMITGKAHWTVNGEPKPTSDDDKGRYMEEVKIWFKLAKKLNVSIPDTVEKELGL
jgi:hypothetical protein